MPMGHLMRGLLGAIAGFALALAAGLPLWMAALAYVGLGNLVMLASVAIQLLMDHARRPPSRPARAPRRAAKMRALHASH
jgi:hypothetical protein